jgi:hypothetical protein
LPPSDFDYLEIIANENLESSSKVVSTVYDFFEVRKKTLFGAIPQ